MKIAGAKVSAQRTLANLSERIKECKDETSLPDLVRAFGELYSKVSKDDAAINMANRLSQIEETTKRLNNKSEFEKEVFSQRPGRRAAGQ